MLEPLLQASFVLAIVVITGWVVSRILKREKQANARFERALPSSTGETQGLPTFDDLVDQIHRQLVERMRGIHRPDMDMESEKRDFRRIIEHVIDCICPLVNLIEREQLIVTVLSRIPRFASTNNLEIPAEKTSTTPASVLTFRKPHWRRE